MTLTSLPVEQLVAEAADGSQAAWNAIVDRYSPLVWSICRRFRLSEADAADVSQMVWLRIVERLPSLREPAALPGWLATTTRRECLRSSSAADRRTWSLGELAGQLPADEEDTALDAELLAAERRAMVREAFAQLPEHCQRLLAVLVADPLPYAEVSARLDMPVGSIGPTRARCLDKLRACPAVARWVTSEHVDQPRSVRHV